MLNAFDCLSNKSLHQQRFGLLFRNTARHEVKFQVLIERAGGRTVAALHIVGKYFELGLVVGLGVLREQQSLRHHLGIGLLRIRTHDDLALKYAAALVIEHGLEYFTALASANLVIEHQRIIGVLLSLEQARPANAGKGALPVKPHENLVAYHCAAGDEGKIVEARARSDRRHHR